MLLKQRMFLTLDLAAMGQNSQFPHQTNEETSQQDESSDQNNPSQTTDATNTPQPFPGGIPSLGLMNLDITKQFPQGFGQQNGDNPLEMHMVIEDNKSIAVDTANSLIEMDIDSRFSFLGDKKEGEMSTSVQGRVSISAGDEKFINHKIVVTNSSGNQVSKGNYNFVSTLVDDNKMVFTGTSTVNSNGNAETGTLKFEITRDANGSCKVSNAMNTTPALN